MSTAFHSVTDFMELVRKSGLISAEKLEQFERDHLADIPVDDSSFAAAKLVRAGLLTNFQAKNLLVGKYKGYTLGPYRVLEPIGSGGMSIVFLAEHVDLKRRVALKVLPAALAKDRATLERFYREAHAAAQLDHPNIVRIHDIMQCAGLHFIVMEYVEGVNLHELLAKIGPLNHHQTVGYIVQAANGLRHAHEKGFVHRDVKPSNLILDKQGTVKILDMGLAKSLAKDQDSLTKQLDEHAVVGTVDIISPEQALNDPVDHRSDIYSLGATMFMLMSGKPPFDGTTAQKLLQHQIKDTPSLTALRQTIPPALSKVVAKMMAKKPEDRYQSVLEVIEALSPWNSDSPQAMNLDDVLPHYGDDPANGPATSKIRSGLRRTIKNLPPNPSKKLAVASLEPAESRLSRWALWGSLAAGILLFGGVIVAWQAGLFEGAKSSPLGPDSAHADTPQKQPPQAEIPKAEVPKAEPPPNKGNLSPAPKKEPLPATPTAIVLLDSATLQPLAAQSLGVGEPQALTVPQATGWRIQVWKKDSAGEWGIEDIAGQRGIWFRSPKGDAGNELAALAPVVSGNMQAQRRLRVTYRTEGEFTATISVRGPGGHPDETHQLQLTAATDRWRTVLYDLRLERDVPLHLVFKNGNKQGHKLYIAQVAIEPLPSEEPVIKFHASACTPFKETLPPNSDGGQRATVARNLGGWSVNSWRDGTIDVEVHELEGRQCLALKTLAGQPTLQMFYGNPPRTKAGRQYTALLEYRTEPNTRATLQIRRGGNYADRVAEQALNATDSWRTIGLTYDATDEHPLMLFVQNSSANGERLFVRSIRVLEDVADPKAVGKILQPLDLTNVFNANGTEMIFSPTVKVALDFTEPGQKRLGGLPFRIPQSGPMHNNLIVLHSRQGTLPPTLPKAVDVPLEAVAKKIHFMVAAGWGFPYSATPDKAMANRGVPKGTESVLVRLVYADGQKEDIRWRNGIELFDYNKRKMDEPTPRVIFEYQPPATTPAVGPRQFRLLTVTPKRAAKIQRIELLKSDADEYTAPIIVAITLER